MNGIKNKGYLPAAGRSAATLNPLQSASPFCADVLYEGRGETHF